MAMQKVDLGRITEEEKSVFTDKIEDLVWKHDISYLEAVTQYCEESGTEVEVIALLVGDQLKSKIAHEAVELRYLPRSSRLPI